MRLAAFPCKKYVHCNNVFYHTFLAFKKKSDYNQLMYTKKNLNIMLLCKVVDNYGDIGFVYRLCRALSDCEPSFLLSLVVSDLDAFAMIAPGVDSKKTIQDFCGWTILDWDAAEPCCTFFAQKQPQVILECFQCGRPQWLEDELFSPEQKKVVQIFNIEYLTAEPWADDFHLLKSATRSAFVKKLNFMPGFTAQTGGLVLDRPFVQSIENAQAAISQYAPFVQKSVCAVLKDTRAISVLFFSYERNMEPICMALSAWNATVQNEQKSVHVLLASGKSSEPFFKTACALKSPFAFTKLPPLPQTAWDALLTRCSFLFVRGEDSFARACLCGVPFVWQAYPQENEFQLVKVHAVLCRMEPFFFQEDFALLSQVWFCYNRTAAPLGDEAKELWHRVFTAKPTDSAEQARSAQDNAPEVSQTESHLANLLVKLFLRVPKMQAGFATFSRSLLANGDLAAHLVLAIHSLHDLF